ncbi:hypothetical protein L1987_00431 [Smallanthus sonchifolius]|uniref:Uncharacterized protein n=1 Tax=Smallanthus sonchifolius TaxID=185202 RepID=A0ACB9K2B0_9ASTR|nr:hypothetical protein L1987_00431 [Smallanthus sonchifolius]
MAACKSHQPILDHPLESPPPLSCKHITPMKPLDGSRTDVFSGFNLNDKSDTILSPDHSSESLSEALGFESFDDVEDFNDQWEERCESVIKHAKHKIVCEPKRSRISGKEIPPPISSIGRRVCFKSYRYNGRLVLKEEKIPTQEILHAFREDGRLKLQFIQFDDDVEAKPESETKSDNGNDNDDGIH